MFVKGNNTVGDDGLDFISHKWQDKTNFQNVVKTLIGYTTPLGTGLLKLNTKWSWNKDKGNSEQELWCQALRMDYFYYSVNSENEISDVTCFIRSFQSTGESADSYCLVEKRYYKEEYEKFVKDVNGSLLEFEDKTHTVRKPYACYRIFRINATSNNNTLAAEFDGSFRDQLRPVDGSRVDGDLIRAFPEDGFHIIGGPDPAADGKGDKDPFRHSAYHIRHRIPGVTGSCDIQKDQFIRTCYGVGLAGLYRIARIPQLYKIDALNDSPLIDIQTGDDSLG